MPAIERVVPISGQMSDPLQEMMMRRLRELIGLALVGFAGVMASALMTWSVADPSLSHATSGAIRNVIGWPGAIGADMLMQILGLGSIMLISRPCKLLSARRHVAFADRVGRRRRRCAGARSGRGIRAARIPLSIDARRNSVRHHARDLCVRKRRGFAGEGR